MKCLICERMLGRLAKWLRILGWDAPLVERAPLRLGPDEVLLTRRVSLAGKPSVVFIGRDRLEEQLRQALTELGLTPDPARFFTRCLECNLEVQEVERAQVMGLVPEHTLHTAQSFTRCPECGKVFWPGSHGERLRAQLMEMLGGAGNQI